MASSAEEVKTGSPTCSGANATGGWVAILRGRDARGRSWIPALLLVGNRQRDESLVAEDGLSQPEPSASSSSVNEQIPGSGGPGPCGPPPLHTSSTTAAWGLLRDDDASEYRRMPSSALVPCRARPGYDQTAARRSTLPPHVRRTGFTIETCASRSSVRVRDADRVLHQGADEKRLRSSSVDEIVLRSFLSSLWSARACKHRPSSGGDEQEGRRYGVALPLAAAVSMAA